MAQIDKQGIWATGRRKTSVARIKLTTGKGKFVINGSTLDDYFGNHLRLKAEILQPLKYVSNVDNYDVFVNVSGGGITGQAEAIRHGISRAMTEMDHSLRPKLKEEGCLRRDDRAVERKKPGQPKARKKFQWTKR